MKVKRFTSKYHHEIIILRYPKEDIRTVTDSSLFLEVP